MPIEDDGPAAMLQRASTDPRAAAQLRAAYRGRHDALDALAWRVSPGSRGSSGTEDPAAFLARLMGDLERDRVLLDEALAAASFPVETPPQDEPELPRPVVRVLPASGILRGALAGLAVGALTVASVVVAVAPTDSLEIFASPAAVGDPLPPGWLLQARSVEASAVRWIGDALGWSVFVLTDSTGHLCMTVVEGDRGSGSCLTPTAFADHGLTVELPVASSSGLSGSGPHNFASWGPVGGLRVEANLTCETRNYPC